MSEASPLPYPITLGGFDKWTTINHFAFDSTGGIVILGLTRDDGLITSFEDYFAAYLPFGASTYLWAKNINL